MEPFKTLKDHVYDYIATQIRIGGLMPGERVNENVICEELRISRTPVREALIQLAAEGVLENKARKGFTIRTMTEEDIKEIYTVIGLLDGYAAREACGHLSKQDLSDMAFYIETIDLAIKNGNLEMYYKQQEIFHQIYISKCENSVLLDSLRQLKNKLLKKTYSDDEAGMTRDALYETNQEHREILRLFEIQDKDGLFRFLSETHWSPIHVSFEII